LLFLAIKDSSHFLHVRVKAKLNAVCAFESFAKMSTSCFSCHQGIGLVGYVNLSDLVTVGKVLSLKKVHVDIHFLMLVCVAID
jgi:hypothetical protein